MCEKFISRGQEDCCLWAGPWSHLILSSHLGGDPHQWSDHYISLLYVLKRWWWGWSVWEIGTNWNWSEGWLPLGYRIGIAELDQDMPGYSTHVHTWRAQPKTQGFQRSAQTFTMFKASIHTITCSPCLTKAWFMQKLFEGFWTEKRYDLCSTSNETSKGVNATF